MKKKLALICMDPDTKRVLSDQLTTLLDDNVSIECYSLQEVTKQHIDAQAILISNYYLLPEIHKKFTWEDSAVVINARRSIGKKGIKALLAIPKGKRCLLYVGNRSLSHYIIKLINYLGINHIELIPEPDRSINYNFHTVDYIINAGKQALSKDVPAIVVDVGILQVDITTLLEVLFALDLTNALASIVSAKYAGEIIELSQEVSLALEQVTQTSKILEVVLNSHLEGIVMLDEEGKILVCNATAETLFAQPQANLAGQAFVKENGFPWDWTELQTVNDRVLRYKNFKLVVDTRPVEAPCGRLGTVLTFRDVTEIQRLEEMVSRDRALKGLEARTVHPHAEDNAECLLVLQKIESLLRCQRSIGRRSLTEAIEGMTEARVRSCLRILGEMGYITVNVGRKGTAISAAGMRVLQKLKTDGKGDV
ncbi:MAG: putative sigma54 specific transcriptional regulator [Firmicutes bacterium]|nr:putative sigma54 specific transcriptional regulator [Bacillota bacterium]